MKGCNSLLCTSPLLGYIRKMLLHHHIALYFSSRSLVSVHTKNRAWAPAFSIIQAHGTLRIMGVYVPSPTALRDRSSCPSLIGDMERAGVNGRLLFCYSHRRVFVLGSCFAPAISSGPGHYDLSFRLQARLFCSVYSQWHLLCPPSSLAQVLLTQI